MAVVTGDALREHARKVLATHVDRDGMCAGCLHLWSRLAPFPCGHVQYARLVLVDEAAWNQPEGRTST